MGGGVGFPPSATRGRSEGGRTIQHDFSQFWKRSFFKFRTHGFDKKRTDIWTKQGRKKKKKEYWSAAKIQNILYKILLPFNWKKSILWLYCIKRKQKEQWSTSMELKLYLWEQRALHSKKTTQKTLQCDFLLRSFNSHGRSLQSVHGSSESSSEEDRDWSSGRELNRSGVKVASPKRLRAPATPPEASKQVGNLLPELIANFNEDTRTVWPNPDMLDLNIVGKKF